MSESGPRAQVAALALCALLSACASTPATHFYTLNPTAPAASAPGPLHDWRIEVEAVSVPESIDRSQIMLMRSGGTRQMLEQDRWVESLPVGIGRVLAADLGRILGTNLTWAAPERGLPDPNVRVTVDIQRFDADNDVVHLEALWSVHRHGADGHDTAQVGRSSLDQAVAGGGVEGIVQAHSLALAAMAGDIAHAIGPNP